MPPFPATRYNPSLVGLWMGIEYFPSSDPTNGINDNSGFKYLSMPYLFPTPKMEEPLPNTPPYPCSTLSHASSTGPPPHQHSYHHSLNNIIDMLKRSETTAIGLFLTQRGDIPPFPFTLPHTPLMERRPPSLIHTINE